MQIGKINSFNLNFVQNNAKYQQAKSAAKEANRDNTRAKALNFSHLYGIKNISFKGSYDNPVSLNQLIDLEIAKKSPHVKQNALGQTQFHEYENIRNLSPYNKLSPIILKLALPLQDKDGCTFAHYSLCPEDIEYYSKILGDESKDVFKKVVTTLDNDCNTIFHKIFTSEDINAIANTLRDSSSEVFEQILLQQNYMGNTILHNSKIDDDVIKVYANRLGSRAPEVFKKALLIKNDKGIMPICYPYSGYTRNNTYKEILGNEAQDVFSYAAQEFSKSPKRDNIVIDKTFIESLDDASFKQYKKQLIEERNGEIIISDGTDYEIKYLAAALGKKAPEVIQEFLSGKYGLVSLSTERMKFYAEILGDSASDIFLEAIKNINYRPMLEYKLFGESESEREVVLSEILGDNTDEALKNIRCKKPAIKGIFNKQK